MFALGMLPLCLNTSTVVVPKNPGGKETRKSSRKDPLLVESLLALVLTLLIIVSLATVLELLHKSQWLAGTLFFCTIIQPIFVTSWI